MANQQERKVTLKFIVDPSGAVTGSKVVVTSLEKEIESIRKSTQAAIDKLSFTEKEILALQKQKQALQNLNNSILRINSAPNLNEKLRLGAAEASARKYNNTIKDINNELESTRIKLEKIRDLQASSAFGTNRGYVPNAQGTVAGNRATQQAASIASEVELFKKGLSEKEAALQASINKRIAIEQFGEKSVQAARIDFSEKERTLRVRLNEALIKQQDRINSGKISAAQGLRNVTRLQNAYQNEVLKTSRALNVLEKQEQANLRTNQSLISRIGQAVLVYRAETAILNGLIETIRNIPRAGIQQQSTLAGLTAIFGSQGASDSLKFVKELANDAGLAIDQLEKSYKNFAVSAKLSGAEQSQFNKIFKEFTEVSTILHLSTDQVNSLFLALEQMYNKNTINMEELKRQLGQVLPGAFEIFAKAAKLSTAQFTKALKDNAIDTKKYLPEAAKLYRKILGGTDDSVFKTVRDQYKANLARLYNEYIDFSRKIFGESQETLTNIIKLGVQSLRLINGNLKAILQIIETITTLVGIKLAGSLITKFIALGEVIKVIGPTGVKEMSRFALAMEKVKTALASLPIATASTGFVVSIGAIAAATVAAASTVDDLHLRYGKFLNANKKDIEELTRLSKIQGKTGEEATKRLQELERIQDTSNSAFIEYQGNQIRFGTLAGTIWERLKIGISEASAAISTYARQKTDFFNGLSNSITKFTDNIIKSIEDKFKTLLETIKKSIAAIYGYTKGAIELSNQLRSGNLQDPFAKAGEAAVQGYTNAYKTLDNLQNKANAKVKETGDLVLRQGELISQGIKGAFDAILEDAVFNQKLKNLQTQAKEPNIPPPDIGTGTGNEDAAAEALKSKQYNSKLRLIENETKTFVTQQKSTLDSLKEAYASGYIGIENFYTKYKKIQEDIIKAQRVGIQKEIGVAISQKDTDKVKELQEELKQLNIEAATGRKELNKDITESLQSYKDLITDIKIQYLELQGKTAEVFDLRFKKDNRDKIQRLLTEQSQGNLTTVSANEALKQINAYKVLGSIEAQIAELEEKRTQRAKEYQNELNRINILKNTGVLDELSAAIEIDKADKKHLQNLKDINAEESKIVLQAGDIPLSKKIKDTLAESTEELHKFLLEGGKVEQLFRNRIASAFDSSFAGFLSRTATAKDAFRNFAQSVVNEINNIIAAQVRSRILSPFLNAAIGVATNVIGAGISGIAGLFGTSTLAGNSPEFSSYINSNRVFSEGFSFKPKAKGGIHNSPSLSQYSNRIYDSPQIFTFAKGGVFAERGPEAILPVKRDKNGNLGVINAGESASKGIYIENLIVNVESREDKTSEEQADDIAKAMRSQLKSLIKKEIADSIRPGNTLNPAVNVSSF